jgi:uroporphyrinogen-III synthase
VTGTPRERLVVVTQADGPGARLISRLESAGVRTWALPVVAFEPAEDARPFEEALTRLTDFDWLVFTSARAVEFASQYPGLVEWMANPGRRPRVAAVGPRTQDALTARGVTGVLLPAESGGVPLARSVISAEGGSLAGRSVLWPRSDIARPDLAEALSVAGARVIDPVVYRTVPCTPADMDALSAALREGRIDAVAFLSPSSAEYLASALHGGTLAALSGRTIVASVGPSTSECLRTFGAPPDVEARTRTGGGLAEALLSCFYPQSGVDP